jgi:hypothetical protein
MRHMRWSWSEYQRCPMALVDYIIDRLKQEHHERESQQRAAQRKR